MKKILLNTIHGLLFCSASLAFSEDYYVPVPKELEPVARIALPEFSMDENELNYVLPKELVGDDMRIHAERDRTSGEKFPRIYRGENAVVSCMGEDNFPVCSVQHKKLKTSALKAEGHLKTRYLDKTKQANAIAVMKKFTLEAEKSLELEEESGGQPLGVIADRLKDGIKGIEGTFENLSLGSSGKDGSRFVFGTASLDIAERKISFTSAGSRLVETWAVTGLTLDPKNHHMTGFYQRRGQKHWFDLDVATDRTSLQGTWGNVDGDTLSEALGFFKTVP